LAIKGTGKDDDAVAIDPTLACTIAAKTTHLVFLKVVGLKVEFLKRLGGISLCGFVGAMRCKYIYGAAGTGRVVRIVDYRQNGMIEQLRNCVLR
jgi:hypothetical protein